VPGEYRFGKRGERCSACGRELAPGEEHYSALLLELAETGGGSPPEQGEGEGESEPRSVPETGAASPASPATSGAGPRSQDPEPRTPETGLPLRRTDLCAGCWDPERSAEYFSFWKSSVPEEGDEEKKPLARRLDVETVYDMFRRLEGHADPAQQKFRFIIALILMRKKRLRFTGVAKGPQGEHLVLEDRSEGVTHKVLDPGLGEEEIDSLRLQVGRLLGGAGEEEAPPSLSPSESEKVPAVPAAAAGADTGSSGGIPQGISAVAVAGGKVAALGAGREEVARSAPAGAEVYAFPGCCVLPGFWDTHAHVARIGAAAAAGPLLYDVLSIKELVERLADFAGRHPEAEVISARAGNLDPAALAEGRLPTAADLDAAAAGRPLVVTDVNKCISNSAALAAAGITRETPEPAGGRLERTPDGEPTGISWFRPGQALAQKALPPAGGDYGEDMVAGCRELAARGVTTAAVGYATSEQIAAVRRVDAEGRLACRLLVSPAAVRGNQLEDFTRSSPEFGAEIGPLARVGPLKLLYDLFVMHRTARMSTAYPGEPENFGDYNIGPEELERRIRIAFDRDFPVAVHVTGDAAAAEAVEFIAAETERRGGKVPAGSFLIHGYFPPPGLPAKMAGLGLGLAAQPVFLYAWADTLEKFVGEERAANFYPLDEYLAAGLAVGAGSDAPVAEFDPRFGLYAMTTRRSASGRQWGPGHALGIETALSLLTDSAARVFPWSGLSGRLAVGEPADFVVLDRDPRKLAPEDLRSIKVVATFVAGRQVYRAGAGGA